MISPSVALGNGNAIELRPASHFNSNVERPVTTVLDLLHVIDPDGPVKKHEPMLWTTALHLSEYANVTLDELPVSFLVDVGPGFAAFLRDRRFSVNSIRTYRQNAQRLLKRADEHGWVSGNEAVAQEWKPFMDAFCTYSRAPKQAIRFAIRNGIKPGDFTSADLERWAESMQRYGRKHKTMQMAKGRFRAAVLHAGLERALPKFNCHIDPSDYRICTAEMPEPLRSEVDELMRWKQARFAKGRPQKARHRPVSAQEMKAWIERLYGFTIRVAQRRDIDSLEDLFSEDIVESFVEWALNTRKVLSSTLFRLTMISGSLRLHPKYSHLDLKWFSDLLGGLPEDSKSERLERKAAKSLPYPVLCSVPVKIRKLRLKTKDEVERAWLAHDELLLTWLTVLPWRQLNLRCCRIGNPETANVFFAPIPTMAHVAVPNWAEKSIAENPGFAVWQFFFREDETKAKRPARGVLPRRLVSLLEEYLQVHRPRLLKGTDPGTLFLNRDGGPLDQQTTTDLVAQRVLEFAGRWVTPHRFRDAFAYQWLSDRPEDYLTLSKVLFHASVKYTLEVYGAKFDESNGARRVDEWLGA